MDLAQLQLFCREVHEELSQVTQEIERRSEDDCEQEVLAMLKNSAEHFLIEKRQYRDQLRNQCEAILGEMSKKKALIGYPVNEDDIAGNSSNSSASTTSTVVAPPYKPLLDRLMIDLEQLNKEVSERSHRRSKQWTKIRDLCDKMAMPIPLLSDSLAESDLAEYESTADSLQQEFARRLKSAHELIAKISEIATYLGDEQQLLQQLQESDENARLDIEFMTSLEKKYQSLLKQYEERKQIVEAIETRITTLSSALEVPAELPSTHGGAGCDARLSLLKQREAEMNALRLERIDVFIQNSRSRIYELWEQLFLDMKLRNAFEGRPGNEELLEDVDREVQRLEKMLADPERQPILAALNKYHQIKANEAKLDEMSHDPGRLARRGFAASLKQEERLRRFNTKFKPDVLETLASLCKAWSAQHNGETFSINNRDISVVLAEESANAPVARRRQSLPPRKAVQTIDVTTKRPKSYAEPRKMLTSPNQLPRTQQLPRPRPQPQAQPQPQPQRLPQRLPQRIPQPQPQRVQSQVRPLPQPSLRSAGGISKPPIPSRSAATTSARARPPRPVVSRPVRPLSSLTNNNNNNNSRAQARPAKINLPRSTPGGPRGIRHHQSTDKENIPAPPSWELEEYLKMQNLEMSYFDETAIPDTSITRQSFDYDRDAF